MTGSNTIPQFYYTYTDHLGSILTMTDSTGTVKGEQSFDAWGRERNYKDWSKDTITQPVGSPFESINSLYGYGNNAGWITRGYTGHEHLPQFDLINMNGRLYDPIVGRMLSPDNYVSDASSTQAFNRYSYVNNNPLKYTDPSGWVPNGSVSGLMILQGGSYSSPGKQSDIINGGSPYYGGDGNYYKDGKSISLDAALNWYSQRTSVYDATFIDWFQRSGSEIKYLDTQIKFERRPSLFYDATQYNVQNNGRSLYIEDSPSDFMQILDSFNRDWNPVGQVILGGYGLLTGRDALNGEQVSKVKSSANLTMGAIGLLTLGESNVETNVVYRAVSDIELQSIKDAGQFTLLEGGVESKYFAKTIEDAQWWGDNLYKDGYTIVKGTVEGPIEHFWNPYTDSRGAYIISKEFLPKILPHIP